MDLTCIESGIECFDRIQKGEEYDLILMDDMMPKLSGTETFEKLKKEIPNFNTPVVILTANAINGMKDKYMEAGFNDYLAKPIEKPELHRVLMKYLNTPTRNKNVEASADEIIDLTGKKILLVDDNKLNIKIAENVLKIYNPTCSSTNSGNECLENLKTNNYDLILMDDMMPEMSGTETMKKLRLVPDFNTPIVVLTANAVDGAKENYLASGFDDYLSKPIDKKELVRVLKTFIKIEEKPKEEVQEEKKEEIEDLEFIDEGNDFHTKEYLVENGIDVDSGLNYLGEMEMYDETLMEFLKEISSRVIKLNQYKLSGSMEEYAIEAHALKSDSKYLGFTKLNALALDHEKNAKENNSDYVNEHFDELMNELNSVLAIVKKYAKGA